MTYAMLALAGLLCAAPLAPANAQGSLGAGNADAAAPAERSPLVQSALQRLRRILSSVEDPRLREQTFDPLFNPQTCVYHRSGLTAAQEQAILAQLQAAGLYAAADAAAFPGGALAGVFPPVREDGSACPCLPQGSGTAPGSNFGGHPSYPGGIAVHEGFNVSSALSFAEDYELAYGMLGADGLLRMAPLTASSARLPGDLDIAHDEIVTAPLWHDWAKTLVFQWNADGTEFPEFNFGGNGATGNYGASGDSRTGGHHILSLAEAIAQADPVARGLLYTDQAGRFHLPPARSGGQVDLNAAGQVTVAVEGTVHNLSDADFVFSNPAVTEAQEILQALAPRYSYDPADTARYTTRFRNPALSFLSGERILILCTTQGLNAVQAELDLLRAQQVI